MYTFLSRAGAGGPGFGRTGGTVGWAGAERGQVDGWLRARCSAKAFAELRARSGALEGLSCRRAGGKRRGRVRAPPRRGCASSGQREPPPAGSSRSPAPPGISVASTVLWAFCTDKQQHSSNRVGGLEAAAAPAWLPLGSRPQTECSFLRCPSRCPRVVWCVRGAPGPSRVRV